MGSTLNTAVAPPKRFSICFWIAVPWLFLCLVWWLARSVEQVREEIKDTGCHSHLAQLSAQMLWLNELGCLPPPCISDEFGKPLYSWRVFTLPDSQAIAEEFDFTKAWNDPGNLKIAQGPNAWRLRNLACPSTNQEELGHTSYFYVLNASDRWPRDFFLDPKLRPKILMVENASLHAHWSEPVDFVFEGSGKEFLNKLRQSHSPHPGGFNAMTTDWARIQIPGGDDHSADRLALSLLHRPRIPDENTEKAMVEGLVSSLIKALDEPSKSRLVALLYLAELGPQAITAVPEVRRIIAQGDAKDSKIAALALARMEKGRAAQGRK